MSKPLHLHPAAAPKQDLTYRLPQPSMATTTHAHSHTRGGGAGAKLAMSVVHATIEAILHLLHLLNLDNSKSDTATDRQTNTEIKRRLHTHTHTQDHHARSSDPSRLRSLPMTHLQFTASPQPFKGVQDDRRTTAKLPPRPPPPPHLLLMYTHTTPKLPSFLPSFHQSTAFHSSLPPPTRECK